MDAYNLLYGEEVDGDGGNNHCCKTPLKELKPIRLCDMKNPMIYKGKYLVCKVIRKPCASFCIDALVMDLNNDFVNLKLYNFCYNLDDVKWISEGNILIVKEPWLHVAQLTIASIIVYSPTDVIFVDPTDIKLLDKVGAEQWYISMSTDSEVWRNQANELFKKGKFDEALILYDRGLRCNPDSACLYLNKSLTCLKIGAFYAGYEAAKIGLEKGSDREKALFRMGQAAYGMREWQKSAKHFIEVLKEFPANKLASEQLKRATARLCEQRNGKFDFKGMFLEAKKHIKPDLDISDYKGPVEISNIPGKGRGIIAAKDIKAGTLLVVSKAVSAGYCCDYPTQLLQWIPSGTDFPSHRLHVIHTMEKMKQNPFSAKEIYQLYSGDDEMGKDEEIPYGIIDASKIDKICKMNRFDNSNVNASNKSDSKGNMFLHILPSYFNHSCLANANRTFYGDVIVVHAGADIQKGEEICLSYINSLVHYPNHTEKLSYWNFTCHCELCEMDMNDNLCSERNQMLEEFMKIVHGKRKSLEDVFTKGEPILQKIRETYSHRTQYKFGLIKILMILAFFSFENSRKAIQFSEEALSLLDDPHKYGTNTVEIYTKLAIHYRLIENFQKSKEMFKNAVEFSNCVDGEHFEMIYSE